MAKTLLKKIAFVGVLLICTLSCKEKSVPVNEEKSSRTSQLKYAKGFTIENYTNLTVLKVNSPWPNTTKPLKYALIPKEKMAVMTINRDEFDAIIAVPIEKIVVTSTTHIPALEALNEETKLIGFPDTQYVSSKKTRRLIDEGHVAELGSNETLNVESVINLQPELVIGFGINGQNAAYKTIQNSNIPVVFNGDWTEENPLGKAEWIKFFALFFQKEKVAENIFSEIEENYISAKNLADKANKKPTVMAGAMYKDIWYLPGGNSWAAQFLKDANAQYLWEETDESGSLSLGWEVVLNTAKNADYWIGSSQFTGYKEMQKANTHYTKFDAFSQKKIHTFANTKGATGGLLFYELAPQRPDLVLKDLIYILHPELRTDYEPVFYTPLKD